MAVTVLQVFTFSIIHDRRNRPIDATQRVVVPLHTLASLVGIGLFIYSFL